MIGKDVTIKLSGKVVKVEMYKDGKARYSVQNEEGTEFAVVTATRIQGELVC